MSPAQVQKDQFISQHFPNLYLHEVPKTVTGTKTSRGGRSRSNKRKGETFKKRKLSDEQIHLLEVNFCIEHKLETVRKEKLALELGLDPRQVVVWFQNRRARWKNKKLEEEYSKLKTTHDRVVVDKCRLEAEVMKLKEQLCQAENEIHKLLKQSDGTLAASCPSSLLSTNTNQKEFLGEFMVDGFLGFDDLLFAPDFNYIHGTGWANFNCF